MPPRGISRVDDVGGITGVLVDLDGGPIGVDADNLADQAIVADADLSW
jgi:hypothetical protein